MVFTRRSRYARKTASGKMIRRKYRRPPMTKGKVMRIIDAELKLRDLGVGPNAIPSITGQISQITAIGQGDLNTQRTGNWIKPTTLFGQVTLKGNIGAAAGVTPLYRVGIACWKQDETANPFALAQVMQNTNSPHQGYRISNKGQFKILWSRTGVLSSQEDNPKFVVTHSFYLKPVLKILYEAAADKNNHLFLFAYSDILAAASPPTIVFDLRLRYTDS